MPLTNGRPTKLTAKLIDQLMLMAAHGLTEAEICYCVGINQDTLHRWKTSPKFSEVIKHAKEHPDEEVERSLYLRAKGMEYIEVSEERTMMLNPITKEPLKDEEGNPVYKIKKTQTKKFIPPDPTSCIFWLKNRRRDLWRSNPEVVIGSNGGGVIVYLPQQLSEDEWNREGARLLDAPIPAVPS